MAGDTAFDLPRGRILPVSRVDVRLEPEPHPFERAKAAEIAANWREESRSNPALFNGTMVLLSRLRWADGVLEGRCHAVRYACMLYWRRHKGSPGIEHSFAFPALVSRDNCLVAVRMGPHTANAGKVYFAAGSFEPSDFVDNRADLHGNMAREVMEETGLDLDDTASDTLDHIYSVGGATAIFRRYWLEGTAEAIAERITAFVASEAEPEIEGPVIICSNDDRPEGLTPHMEAIVDWHFSGAAPPRPRQV